MGGDRMAIGDLLQVRRACLGYGPDTPEAPEKFDAGFRVELRPMLWAMKPAASGTSRPRSPNVLNDDDPAWQLSDPARRWWVLAEMAGFPLLGQPTDVRLAWPVPSQLADAQLRLGLHLDGNWTWDELQMPELAEDLAISSYQYLQDLNQSAATAQFLTRIERTLADRVGEGVSDAHLLGSVGGLTQPELMRLLAEASYAAPPRSAWLKVFDQRHDAALSGSAREVSQHVAAQRPFAERGQRRLQHGVDAVRAARIVVPTGFAGLGSVAGFGAAEYFSRGFPEVGTYALLSVAAAALLAKGAVDIGGMGLRALRSRLARSLGLPDASTPTDHPEVLRSVGYRPRGYRLTAAEHTTAAVKKLGRGRSAG